MNLRSQAMLSVLVPVIFLALIALTSLSLPEAGGTFNTSDGQVFYSDLDTGPRSGVESERVIAFVNRTAQEQRIVATPELFIEEPDSLPLIEDYRRVMDEVGLVSSWLLDNQLSLVLDDGRLIDVDPRSRTLADLRFDFWIQAFSGFLAALICFLVLLLSSDKSERSGRIAFVLQASALRYRACLRHLQYPRFVYSGGSVFCSLVDEPSWLFVVCYWSDCFSVELPRNTVWLALSLVRIQSATDFDIECAVLSRAPRDSRYVLSALRYFFDRRSYWFVCAVDEECAGE